MVASPATYGARHLVLGWYRFACHRIERRRIDFGHGDGVKRDDPPFGVNVTHGLDLLRARVGHLMSADLIQARVLLLPAVLTLPVEQAAQVTVALAAGAGAHHPIDPRLADRPRPRRLITLVIPGEQERCDVAHARLLTM